MAEAPPGFLGRWSRRKHEALKSGTPEEPVLSPSVATAELAVAAMPATHDAAVATTRTQEPVLSLDDVRLLTKDSDFKPFMASGVDAGVRNAAVKKLFADPHFNVMDGLDTYIDDYSKSDPIPEAMLRQMTSAKFLGLFADEEDAEKQAAAVPGENADNPRAETVSQSCENADTGSAAVVPDQPPSPPASLPDAMDAAASQEAHADTDLRLQPDDATPAPATGHGTQ